MGDFASSRQSLDHAMELCPSYRRAREVNSLGYAFMSSAECMEVSLNPANKGDVSFGIHASVVRGFHVVIFFHD